jgi:multiple sugar transport system substrate-binding protein
MTEFRALAEKMQADGLVPLALGDADGWPAMGIFDILDMRLNGYDFHIGLMAGTQKWTDPRVKAVFEQWRSLLPYMSPNATGTSWWDGAGELFNGTAGMDFIGTFASWAAPDEAALADLDMFPFPVLGNGYDAEMAIDAPVDGLALSTARNNPTGAKKLLACAASGPAQLKFLANDPSYVAAARTASTAKYTPYQKRMAAVIGSSKKIAQFMDRDSRPDFTGPDGMQAFLANFLDTPSQDLDAYLSGIQAYWDGLPAQ